MKVAAHVKGAIPVGVKRVDGTSKYAYIEFQDLGDMLAWNKREDNIAPCNKAKRSSISPYDAKWTGTKTYEEAEQLARWGWPEGRSHIEKFRSIITEAVATSMGKPQPVHDIVGQYVDVPWAMSGLPDAFVNYDEGELSGKGRGSKIVKVVCNGSVSSGVDHKVIHRRGAAVCALVDALEQSGRRVELILDYASNGYKESVLSRYFVKHAHEALDLDKIAFALVHPAMFRRLGFATWERFPEDVCQAVGITPGGGYGRPGETPDDKEMRGDIYTGAAHLGDGHWHDDGSATKEVLRMLESQGVEVRL